MKNKFYISDTHFGHKSVWEKFKNPDGSPLRDFQSTEDMDEHMIAQWNSVVGPYDTVYHLGDVVINNKFLHQIKRLNGKKKLIMGNHDIFGFQKYIDAGFYEVCSYRVFVDDFVCSHIPLHPDCISTRFVTNVHGHLHGNDIMWERQVQISSGWSDYHSSQPAEYDTIVEKDPRYYSVCVEKLDDYKPIAHEDLKIEIKKRQEASNYTPPAKGWGNGSGPG